MMAATNDLRRFGAFNTVCLYVLYVLPLGGRYPSSTKLKLDTMHSGR